MGTRIRDHVRSNVVGYVSLFLALTMGTAYATHPGGANTISSGDIINGEVKSGDVGDFEVKGADIAPDSLGGAKIADKSVKNADLSTGASSSNTIADGGIQGVDVKNDTLTSAQIDESSLGTVPDADKLDGLDSTRLVNGRGSARGGYAEVPEGSAAAVVSIGFSANVLLSYHCPQDSATNGSVRFFNGQSQTVKLFVDNGSPNPSFIGDIGVSGTRFEPAAASGDYLVFQVQNLVTGRTVTAHVFSVHDPASDMCYAQAQAVHTDDQF